MNAIRSSLKQLKEKIKHLKHELGALYIASKRDDIGLVPKAIAVLVVAYALSPIDLIPDFIPVLGHLDDLLLLPLGIMLVIKLIPDDVMNECREEARKTDLQERSMNWMAAGVIIIIWILALSWIITELL